jgi:hypothetical protein
MEVLDDKLVCDFRHGSQGTFLLGLYIVRVASDALSMLSIYDTMD